MRRSTTAFGSAAFLAISIAAHATSWVRIEQIHPTGLAAGTAGVRFGASVAADVHYGPDTVRALYIGAPGDSVDYLGTAYAGAGAVYIYTPHDGHWQFSSRMIASPPQANAHFGAALAVQNGMIAVGEPDRTVSGHAAAGKAWFYGDINSAAPNGSEPLPVLLGQRTVAFDNARLGASVAVGGAGAVLGGGGTWLAAGAPGLQGIGCVYLSQLSDDPYSSGSYSEIDSTCGANAGDAFGTSVAIRSLGSNQLDLVVGATGVNQGGQAAAGAAYVFVLANGNLTDVGDLHAQNPNLIDAFGASVAIDAYYVYVGATGRDNGAGRTGSVTLFTPAYLIGYNFDSEEFPGNAAHAGDLCGAAVYPNPGVGNRFISGCPGSDGTLTNEGAARVYGQYSFVGSLVWLDDLLSVGSAAHGADDLGRGVVLIDDHAFVGAPLTDDAIGADNGAVDVFAPDLVFRNGFQ